MKKLSLILAILLCISLLDCGRECAHDYQAVKTLDASCTQDGYTKYECAICGNTYKDKVRAIGHNYADPACTAPPTCRVCGASSGIALGHNYTETTCSRCGYVKSDYEIPNGGYDGSPVTIKFYHQMGAALQQILNDAIYEFNKLYPNISIEHQAISSYDDLTKQLSQDTSMSDTPNLAYCNPEQIALFHQYGSLIALDHLMGDETLGFTNAQLSDFIPGFLEEGRQFGDGSMYSLPISKSTDVLYYNKTFFDEHGLTVPTTWNEMEEVCKKIKEIDPNSIPLGYDSDSNWFINMCLQSGSDYTSSTGEHYIFNNDTNQAFAARFRSWYEKGWVTTKALYGEYTSSLFSGTNSYGDPSGKRCYMCISSTSEAIYQQPSYSGGKFEFEVGISTLPQVDPSTPKAVFQGPSVCIFKSEDINEVLASWLFAKYLATDVTFQAAVSMHTGNIPVIRSVQNNPIYQYYLKNSSTGNIQAYAIKTALAQFDAYTPLPAFPGCDAAQTQVGLMMQKCLVAQAPNVDTMIKQAFEDAVAECKKHSGQ